MSEKFGDQSHKLPQTYLKTNVLQQGLEHPSKAPFAYLEGGCGEWLGGQGIVEFERRLAGRCILHLVGIIVSFALIPRNSLS